MIVQSRHASPTIINDSKIAPPLLQGQWVRRHRIEARLDHGHSRSLTVVIAPAGHGKTSTVVNWLRLRQLEAAWVSLDRRDTDLTRFAAHVAAALDRLVPSSTADLFALLRVPDRLSPYDLGEAYGETLYDLETDVVLVLDDFHTAGDGAAAFVFGLLEAAPRRLHTIVCSRVRPPFPMARFRVSGDVEELTGGDLRFSPDETRHLLHLETGEEIDPERAARLQASVGGWPAAIRLVALSRDSGKTWFPEESHDGHSQLLRDYLGEEVLGRLPTLQRNLLLWATLTDRFTLDLLADLAATHGTRIPRADLDRLRTLELYREIPGLSEIWYAYHPLFREILRRELERTSESSVIVRLHVQIAQWFADQGHTQEAVHHLVAAGDVAAAAQLITSRVSEAFAREDWQSVAEWMKSVPIAAILENPELLLASGWVAYLSGRDPRIADILARLRDTDIRGLVTAAQRAEMALLADWPEGDLDAWIGIAEHAIAHIPPVKRYQYGYAHLTLGMSLASAGRDDEALIRLAAFVERESARVDGALMRGYFGRVLVLWQAGRLERCAQTASDLLQLAETNNLAVSAGWGAVFLGAVAHERGNLDEAARHFEDVVARAERMHFTCLRDAFFSQILIYQAQGLHEEADRALARVREIAIAAETPHQMELVDSLVARVALMRGDLVSAQRWLETSSPRLDQDDFKSVELPVLTRAKVLVALATSPSLIEASPILAAFVDHARATHMRLALLEGLAMQALLHDASGEPVLADPLVRVSLELAAPEGIVQRYAYLGPSLVTLLRRHLAAREPVPHARRVLGSLEAVLAAQSEKSRAFAGAARDLVRHPLTDRELDVVRLLALRLTNNEIGEELFISPITVKHHVANIAGKLGVSGRRAAVAHARELGLVS